MPHALPLEAIATIFCTTYPAGGTVLAATRVPRAYNYEVWCVDARHGRYALRVARAETDPARLANALTAQRLATAAGVPGPQFLGYDEGALIGRAVYVQEWVAGTDAEARLHVYRGMEYLAEVYRMTQRGEVARAAHFQTLLRGWLSTH